MGFDCVALGRGRFELVRAARASCISRRPCWRMRSFPMIVPRILQSQPCTVDGLGRRLRGSSCGRSIRSHQWAWGEDVRESVRTPFHSMLSCMTTMGGGDSGGR